MVGLNSKLLGYERKATKREGGVLVESTPPSLISLIHHRPTL